MANPDEWVKGIARREWFYNDKTPALQRRKIAEAKLVEWNMLEPVMAEIEAAIGNSQRFSWSKGMWMG